MTGKFQKGMPVVQLLTGFGDTSEEESSVLKIDKKGVWLDNGAGNDPSGPFDPDSGRYLGARIAGFSSKIEPAVDAAPTVPKARGRKP